MQLWRIPGRPPRVQIAEDTAYSPTPKPIDYAQHNEQAEKTSEALQLKHP